MRNSPQKNAKLFQYETNFNIIHSSTVYFPGYKSANPRAFRLSNRKLTFQCNENADANQIIRSYIFETDPIAIGFNKQFCRFEGTN